MYTKVGSNSMCMLGSQVKRFTPVRPALRFAQTLQASSPPPPYTCLKEANAELKGQDIAQVIALGQNLFNGTLDALQGGASVSELDIHSNGFTGTVSELHSYVGPSKGGQFSD